MENKVAFQNFKDEQELESWNRNTAKGYLDQQIASLRGYPHIKKAAKEAIYAIE